MANAQRVAIVTGASRGIGAGLVAGYRGLGYGVVATSRSLAPSTDDHVLAIPGDIRDRATAKKVVTAAKERFGRVDTLVNNAGFFVTKPFGEFTQEDFDAAIGTNVTGLFHMTQVVLAELLERRSGHIVNISGASAPIVDRPAGLAALTKGGVSALTKSLAIEVARRGVRVNAVAPGTIKTPMHERDAAKLEALAKLHPLGRMGEVKDIVDAVLYLESASFVTGEILHVDGGMAAGLA